MAIVKDLGMVTAYAYAVAGGYEGTEAEFEQMLGQAGITLEQLENLTAVATTLTEGSEATASYSEGVLTFGIPRGNTGAKGNKGDKGDKGDTGNGIASIAKTGTSGLVDTYTITFTDGTTTTFTVTNGADGDITNVAEAFDSTKAYSVGDMVLYQGTLYAFTAAHSAGAWIGTDAQAVILADVVSDLKSDLSDVNERLSDAIEEFAVPTQEAVDNWLNNHPEATTTVEDNSLTLSKFTDSLKLYTVKDYVTPQMYGAVGDGITDDTNAFVQAISTGKTVLVPNGTYIISSTLKMPYRSQLIGTNKYRTILKFANDINAIQIDHSVSISNISINTYGESAGLYLYVPDDYSYNLGCVCENIIIDHVSDTDDGDGILLVSEAGTRIEGAYNLTFRDINIKHRIRNGIHLLAKAKTVSKSETWITDVLFEDIFIDKAKRAILSDWVDISNSNAVPQTGTAPSFGAIKFSNVSAQYVTNVSECFCKIMNIDDCVFSNCVPFDYYNLVYLSPAKAPYIFNATSTMCSIDMGMLPEIFDTTRFIAFENSSGNYNNDFKTVVKYLGIIGNGNRIYGNFYNPINYVTGNNAITLTAETAELIAADLVSAGNTVSVMGQIRLTTGVVAGNNVIGKVNISPNTLIYAIGTLGSSGQTGTLVRIEINPGGGINVVSDSTNASSVVLRFYAVFIRKYYLYQ